jgi:dihydroxy-acid dehydratase
LAKDGAVAKITGKEGELFTGPAKVFEDEFEAVKGIQNSVAKGDVIVIRNSGPKGAPGMPEMLKPTSVVMGVGLGKDVALITDGRFSGGSHGFVVGHITPEACEGGLIGLLHDGDIITIDVELSDEEIVNRRKAWKKPPYKATSGILKKYIALVSTASEGCTTDD